MNRRSFLKVLGVASTIPIIGIDLESNELVELESEVAPKKYVKLVGENPEGTFMAILNSHTNEVYYNGLYKQGIISLDNLPDNTTVRINIRHFDYRPFSIVVPISDTPPTIASQLFPEIWVS